MSPSGTNPAVRQADKGGSEVDTEFVMMSLIIVFYALTSFISTLYHLGPTGANFKTISSKK